MRPHLTMSARVERDFLIALLEVALHIRTHADRSGRKHRMTWGQWMILRRLEGQPDISQSEHSAIAGIAPITVARLTDRIEALGLVKRHEDPTDRRIWRLRVTPAAASALRDGRYYQAELDELIIKGVDSAALDAVIVGLHKMKPNLSGRRRIAKAPRLPKQRYPEGSLASRGAGASSPIHS